MPISNHFSTSLDHLLFVAQLSSDQPEFICPNCGNYHLSSCFLGFDDLIQCSLCDALVYPLALKPIARLPSLPCQHFCKL